MSRFRALTASLACAVLLGAVAFVEVPGALADPLTNCASSGGHTLCLTAPSNVLTGEQQITVTNAPNAGKVIFTWLPSNKRVATYLQTSFVSNPTKPQNYSFFWPTQKYPDATGTLQAQFGSTANEIVPLGPLTLSNGNAAGTYQRNERHDWTPPAAWTGITDPTIAAVGDGASNEKASNAIADAIVRANPAMFFYLGDVYEEGTFTEWRNHFGLSAVDDPNQVGTMWGRLAAKGAATFGNHEAHSQQPFLDYWHLPEGQFFWSFQYASVQFFNLWSANGKFDVGTTQYNMVQNTLQSLAPNTCVVALWHRPVTVGGTVRTSLLPMWQLLANNGGDLVLNGDAHYMAEFKPMDANLDATTPEAHMVQLISGAGGHALAATKVDPDRMSWPTSALKRSGWVSLTLDGVVSGGTATSISYEYRDATGAVVDPASHGTVTC